jgi:hypothetical protein
VKVYYVYTEEYLSQVECIHQRAWMADWCAWKLAWNYFEGERRHDPESWRLMWVSEPWAGPPGWAFGPHSSEAYSYAVPVKVEVP